MAKRIDTEIKKGDKTIGGKKEMVRTATGRIVEPGSVKGTVAVVRSPVRSENVGKVWEGIVQGASLRDEGKFDWIKKGEKLTSEIESTLGSSWNESRFLSDMQNGIDKVRITETIESGIPYKSFEEIYKQSPFTQAFWAEVLGLSTKSLNRYKQTRKKFKPLQSEKIIELAEVTGMGKKAFANDKDFELWLNTPSLALGSNRPIDLIKNSYGKELVVTELTNIDQGIFV
jgi:putative toxin-antitoxin system antitoxin component (TIGR02293 family)